jgi:hypothetical protein
MAFWAAPTSSREYIMLTQRSRGSLLVLSTIVGACSVSIRPAAAQEEVLAPRERSPFVAGALAVLPTWGHSYAGDWETGGKIGLVMVGGFLVFWSGWAAGDDCVPPTCNPSGPQRREQLGSAIFVGAYLYSLMDAPQAARRQNRARAAAPLSGAQAGLFIAPDGGSGVRITMPVGR